MCDMCQRPVDIEAVARAYSGGWHRTAHPFPLSQKPSIAEYELYVIAHDRPLTENEKDRLMGEQMRGRVCC